MIEIIKNFLQKKAAQPAAAAYDTWSASYDHQPGNLMLDLDEQLFAELTKNTPLQQKKIADVGCGTGRHWPRIYAAQPALIMGFDVSAGMLAQLALKFPAAVTQQITDNRLQMVPDAFADCLLSTLTVAHIKNIEEAIAAWVRITKKDADMFITDFHPDMLAKGGKRSFRHQGKSLSVVNYVHSLPKLKKIFARYGLRVMQQIERTVDEEVKHYYAAQDALPVYERFKGMPVIYGLHVKKTDAAQ